MVDFEQITFENEITQDIIDLIKQYDDLWTDLHIDKLFDFSPLTVYVDYEPVGVVWFYGTDEPNVIEINIIAPNVIRKYGYKAFIQVFEHLRKEICQEIVIASDSTSSSKKLAKLMGIRIV